MTVLGERTPVGVCSLRSEQELEDRRDQSETDGSTDSEHDEIQTRDGFLRLARSPVQRLEVADNPVCARLKRIQLGLSCRLVPSVTAMNSFRSDSRSVRSIATPDSSPQRGTLTSS
jgi:hypothetical protein